MAEYPVNVIENAFCSTEEKQNKTKSYITMEIIQNNSQTNLKTKEPNY